MFIGQHFRDLDQRLETFSVEVFASVLRNEWIDAALEITGRSTRRSRKLSARFTVWLLIGMACCRNLSIQNVVYRMGSLLGLGSLWRNGKPPSSASVVEARDRLGVAPLRDLCKRLQSWILERYETAMSWRGLRILAIDGTTFKVPDSPENREHFGLPGASRGRAAFPQVRALFLVSTKLHFIVKALFAPYRTSENELALKMLASIPKGTLIVADRLFDAWRFLFGVLDRESHFLVRARENMRGNRQQRLGRGDNLVEMTIHRALRRQFPQIPRSFLVREICVKINGKNFRFFTSLLDANRYPAAELVCLYSQRWEEEVVLDAVKTHQFGATTVNRPVIFRCMKPRRVWQEAYAMVLGYNLVRALMAAAAERRAISPLRISFVDSLMRIRDAALVMARASTRALPEIFDQLLVEISRCVLPVRRKRSNPRAVCIKMSAYPLKLKSA